jgi:hypothetical protein
MEPSPLLEQLLLLSDVVSGLLAYKLTPDPIRQILLNLTKQIKETLPADDLNKLDAAEAKAILRALAYRRED